jgi:hypothetical protein
MIAKSLILQYNLKENSYYAESPYTNRNDADDLVARERTKQLQEKWKSHIPPRWYGFKGVGTPVPLYWFSVIDEFLDYVKSVCPDFEIHQIKLKFGGIRIYLDKITPEIAQDIKLLHNVLHDEYLIY